jgi:deoxyribodipyrimidine photo-lyase
MQQSQRTRFNHALEFAIEQANALKLPLVVCFGLMDDYPEANARHYAFMLEGLVDVYENLGRRGIRFVIKRGNPAEVAIHYARDASLVVADRGYLRHQKAWRSAVAEWCAKVECPLYRVESDLVVPVETASNKRESAARTIRPKIEKHLKEHLTAVRPRQVVRPSVDLNVIGDIDPELAVRTLARLSIDRSIGPVPKYFIGGEDEAAKRLAKFMSTKLKDYAEARSEPASDATTRLSPYLHFGQISPLELAVTGMSKARSSPEIADALIEELIVRRELAANYCEFTENYDSYDALPGWAKQTLKDHAKDKREHIYTIDQLRAAQTHDPYWNAAQSEMAVTGYMHNYMRMYWGKKILEWSRAPQEGFDTTLRLNNAYLLDGRDFNSYASVGWIYGLHDRPWTQREIFGTVRYMNSAGLERKFDMEAYVKKIAALTSPGA